jgi:hypothetical protein
MKRFPIFLALALLLLAVCVPANDTGLASESVPVAVAVAADPTDHIATLIGYVWAALTAIGAIGTALAAFLRTLRGTDSTAASLLDRIAHWASVLGTSTRRSQIAPPQPSNAPTIKP